MKSFAEKHGNILATTIGLAILSLVYFRLMPTLPSVMQDELVYMVQSRHTDPEDARFPNYLFSWVYSSSVFFGVDFYNYVKLLNFAFLAGFGAVVYLLTKKTFSLWLSIVVSTASVIGPASLYGSVFMPEAMYMFFAALSFMLALKVPVSSLQGSWKLLLLAGGALGLTALVKPHALFLAVGFALFFIFSTEWRSLSTLKRTVNAGVFLASTLLMKLVGGFLLAGPSGLTLFGGYGSIASLLQRFTGLLSRGQAPIQGTQQLELEPAMSMSFVELATQQFALHLVAIGFLLAPAWFVFFTTKFSVKSGVAELALLTLAVMMIASSIFGAYVTFGGDDHTDRVLLRYYEFLIPLVYLGAFQILKQKRPSGIAKFSAFGFFVTSSIVIAANGMRSLDFKITDSAYLLGIFDNIDQLWLYSGALILAFLFMLGGPVKLAEYTAATVSVAIALTGYSAQQNQLDINSTLIGSDYAGQYVRDQLPDVPGEEIFVVGSSKTLVEASIFWMDRPGVTFELYSPGSQLPESEIPEGKSVVVQVLDVQLDRSFSPDVVQQDWQITFLSR